MRLRFRTWMPVAALLTVLATALLVLLYGIPISESRLSNYSRSFVLSRAAAVADAVGEGGDPGRALRVSVGGTGGQALFVNSQGEIIARAGPRLMESAPEEALQAATEGRRYGEETGGMQIAVAPVVSGGEVQGGVLFVSNESNNVLYGIFLRTSIEAAAIASVLGGGLALLLATVLSRRVERLTAGARAMQEGDLSRRIESLFGDEIGDLARAFNDMAARLERSFDELEEKGSTLDAILNNLSEGVLATDLKGNALFANRAARSMIGLGETDLPAKLPEVWEEFDLPEAVARCARREECILARVEAGEGLLQVRLEHLPAFDERRGGVLVVLQDLSEGQRLEANQQRFLANAAHELKTPITAILGAAELLQTTPEEDTGARRRMLKHILSESRRMQRLSETLLRLARTGSEQREPRIEPVDLAEVVREAAGRVAPLAESADLQVSVEGSSRPVLADREWLEQCLLILLHNAIQHSGPGGSLWVRLRSGAVSVEDEGSGIPEEDLPHVFERFYRNRHGDRGFGLGLPICKELAERMGGQVSLRSRQGEGTSVEIRLPEDSR
jgi:two-component system sensor histidine kinase VicK